MSYTRRYVFFYCYVSVIHRRFCYERERKKTTMTCLRIPNGILGKRGVGNGNVGNGNVGNGNVVNGNVGNGKVGNGNVGNGNVGLWEMAMWECGKWQCVTVCNLRQVKFRVQTNISIHGQTPIF